MRRGDEFRIWDAVPLQRSVISQAMPWLSSGWVVSLFLQPSVTGKEEECGAEDVEEHSPEVEAWRSAVQLLVDRTDRCIGVDDLDHIQQCYDWDCGIACLEMILRAWFSPAASASTATDVVTREWLIETIDTQSTWTADVVYVLNTFLEQQASQSTPSHTVSYIFSSQSLAVNENLQSLPYYAQQFACDTQRVRARLVEHSGNGFQRSRPYPLSEILDCVQYQGCVAILLVDANRLRGHTSSTKHPTATLPYTGHYLVVVGVQQQEQQQQKQYPPTMVYVNDPGVAEGRQCVPVQRLEQAWHATGTDSDVILLVRHPREGS